MPREIDSNDPAAQAVVRAIENGDVEQLARLLDTAPDIAHAYIVRTDPPTEAGKRTLLHILADWPGHRPRGAETAALLIKRGADVNAPFVGRHSETPLHWAASSDDIPVLDALLDNGADIEAPGGVIANGTPMADAVAFSQWKAAQRLLERGARTSLWQAAALGLLDRVERIMTERDVPRNDVTEAFWCACHGGRRNTAAYLLEGGADINWVGFDGLTPLEAAKRAGADDVVAWLTEARAKR